MAHGGKTLPGHIKGLSNGTIETSVLEFKLLDHLRSSPVPLLSWTTRLQTDARVRNGNGNQTLGVDGNASTSVQLLVSYGKRSVASTDCKRLVETVHWSCSGACLLHEQGTWRSQSVNSTCLVGLPCLWSLHDSCRCSASEHLFEAGLLRC